MEAVTEYTIHRYIICQPLINVYVYPLCVGTPNLETLSVEGTGVSYSKSVYAQSGSSISVHVC